MTTKAQFPAALLQALAALEQAPDWRYVGHPHYEAWHKGPRLAAIAALQQVGAR